MRQTSVVGFDASEMSTENGYVKVAEMSLKLFWVCLWYNFAIVLYCFRSDGRARRLVVRRAGVAEGAGLGKEGHEQPVSRVNLASAIPSETRWISIRSPL